MIKEGDCSVHLASTQQIGKISRLEADVLIGEVFKGNLPTCDLGLPEGPNRIKIVQATGLQKYVEIKRQQVNQDLLTNPNRRIVVFEDNSSNVLGVGKVKFKSQQKEVVLHSFNVKEAERGDKVGFELLKACINLINEEDISGNNFDTIVIARYEKTERKHPFFERLTDWVNSAQPNTIKRETYLWKGQKVTRYLFPREIAEDLVEELGDRLTMLLT